MKQEDLNYINFSQKEVSRLHTDAKNGSVAALNELSGTIRNIAKGYFLSKYRYGKIQDTDDVEDLAQIVAAAFAKQYSGIENLENWLRRVLFITFISWYKKKKSRGTTSLKEAYPLPDTSVEKSAGFDKETIRKCIDALPEEKQNIIRMRIWDDLKFADIADKLSKNEDAVKKIFYRAILEIKDKLKEASD